MNDIDPTSPRNAPGVMANLWRLEHDLIEQRDVFRDLVSKYGHDHDKGRVAAFELALDFLHSATVGEFGQTLSEQRGGAR